MSRSSVVVTLPSGHCHCRNVLVTFETTKPLEQLVIRACTCSFCTQHGARHVTDPEGFVQITVRDPSKLNRYRFALKTADFLVCRECGIYLGAIYTEGDKSYATVNVNNFEQLEAFLKQPQPVSYDHETEIERRARRKAKWTPVRDY